MTLSRNARRLLAAVATVILVGIYLPLVVVVINSFNTSQAMTWPPSGLTLEWWKRAGDSQGARDAVLTSVQVAALSTAIALVLGTLLALALQRFEFFGKSSVNLLVILPIALPGIVTGAGPWTTLRLVTFPQLRSALLAFALSFDEIIVTTFTAGSGVQTLPIWILGNLFRPNQAPVVNVVAVVLIAVSIIPIWIAQKLAGVDELTSGSPS